MEKIEYQIMDAIENEHAWFLAKYQYLFVIFNKIGLGKDKKILDIGCGTGAVMKKLSEAGYLIEGIDNSEEALNFCRQKDLTVSNGTAEKINVPDNYCEAVISLDVLEHLENDQAAVDEFKRVVKPGGYVIATVPAHQFLWSYHDVSLHHQRRYSKQKFLQLFGNDFEIVLSSWLHTSILLPTVLLRTLKRQSQKEQAQSDVEMPGKLLNSILKLIYSFEIMVFKIFSYLPFGLSLVVVARKK